MIETSTIVGLYLAGVLEITIPLFALYFLYRRHRYSISSLFFRNPYLLRLNKSFDSRNYISYRRVSRGIRVSGESVLSVSLDFIRYYGALSASYPIPCRPLHPRGEIDDAMTPLAMGLAYWLPAIFSNSATVISQGSLSRTVNSGKIEELVTGDDYNRSRRKDLSSRITVA